MDDKAERDRSGRFLPGHEGGPGRPKGSRNKISEKYLGLVLEELDRRGPEVFKDLSAAELARACSACVPKELSAAIEHSGGLANLLATPSEETARLIAERVAELIPGDRPNDTAH